MRLPEKVWWTLNRLDAIQRSGRMQADGPVEVSHLEALEDENLITVRAIPNGWNVYVLPDGQRAIENRRKRGVRDVQKALRMAASQAEGDADD